jgi:PhzF family phenazine biosynthesis protein
MGVPIYQVDSFTDKPFAGNPAGVCVLPEPVPEAWMQHVAAEMNLSETAFIHPRGPEYDLRWFTPQVEVDLCGHATLATAHILWESRRLPADAQARFHTRSGLLVARRDGDVIRMDFPAVPLRAAEAPAGFAQALGAEPVRVAQSRKGYLAELASERAVRELAPDVPALGGMAWGVIVTARGEGGGFDFVSRYFAPGAGIHEDPVTGSAHCSLGPYWKERLGKDSFTAFQASARGGVVQVRVAADRVELGGHAVTVFRGEMA